MSEKSRYWFWVDILQYFPQFVERDINIPNAGRVTREGALEGWASGHQRSTYFVEKTDEEERCQASGARKADGVAKRTF